MWMADRKMIYLDDAIHALMQILDEPNHAEFLYTDEICRALKDVPSAQPKLSPEVQDILDYLDTVLHPIVSPERWDVYADLHDMVSMLPSTQPRKGEWVEIQDDVFAPIVVCSNCGQTAMVEDGEYQRTPYCPKCGAEMER